MNIVEMFGDRWKEADLAQIPDGCPMLEEHRCPQTGDAIVELVLKRASMKPHDSLRYYLDSLWTAPPKPPKRGSKLKVWQLAHLPIGSVVLDASGDSWHALQGYEGCGTYPHTANRCNAESMNLMMWSTFFSTRRRRPSETRTTHSGGD